LVSISDRFISYGLGIGMKVVNKNELLGKALETLNNLNEVFNSKPTNEDKPVKIDWVTPFERYNFLANIFIENEIIFLLRGGRVRWKIKKWKI
jgi:hypothetical protein